MTPTSPLQTFRERLFARAACGVVCLLAAAAGAVAQREELPEPVITDSGIGRVVFEDREAPLSYSLSPLGDLFALQPIVALLGGELDVGPLGESHTLRLFGDEFVFGPLGRSITVNDEIVQLTRHPLASTSGLQVPIDLLRKVYGDRYGFVFDWQRGRRLLTVQRRQGRQLDLDVSAVRIAGVTHLILQFDQEPEARTSRPDDQSLSLQFPGDTLVFRGSLPRSDTLLREVRVGRDRLDVFLQPGASAADPLRVARGGRVRLIVDISSLQVTPTATVRRPPTSFRGPRIVIDPGHGGQDVGALGASGTQEKDLTLAIARSLRRRLEATLPVQVLLTRDQDVAVAHSTRTAIANQNEATLFISLHLNSEPGGRTARGAETYFLDQSPSDQAAAAAARFENEVGGEQREEVAPESATDELGLQLMLWDLAQSRHLEESRRFAALVQRELNEALELRDRGVKQAPFRVLVGATMPAVLVELGFLSNPTEEERLSDSSYREQLVGALSRSVRTYLESIRRVEPEDGDDLSANADGPRSGVDP